MSQLTPFKFPERYKYSGKRLEGGQGFVYVCDDLYLERQVAIKVVSTPSSLALLRQELSFLTTIRTPHIAEVYDLLESTSGKHIGLVQEFVSGPHLLENPGPVPGAIFLKTLYQLSSGLADIHSFSKVHRDIKPSNVRFDQEGVVKILDFGISAHVEGESVTSNGKGTIPYLAPELYSLPATYTKAVDVYSFGVLAYQMAFGKTDGSLNSLPPRKGAQPKSFADSNFAIASEIVSLLDRTLVIQPTGRPSAAEIRETLERRLNYGLHRAAISYRGSLTVLGEANKAVTLTFEDCSIAIKYDGLKFIVSAVAGSVDINNMTVQPQQELPGSCVVTLRSQGGGRQFIRELYI